MEMIMTAVVLSIPQFPTGMSIASSARVGNALGSGDVAQAISSYKVAVICTCKNVCNCCASCKRRSKNAVLKFDALLFLQLQFHAQCASFFSQPNL